MTNEQKAAYVMAQAAAANAEVAAMQAANQYREMQGHTIAYDEAAFLSMIDKYQLHHNDVLGMFHT